MIVFRFCLCLTHEILMDFRNILWYPFLCCDFQFDFSKQCSYFTLYKLFQSNDALILHSRNFSNQMMWYYLSHVKIYSKNVVLEADHFLFFLFLFFSYLIYKNKESLAGMNILIFEFYFIFQLKVVNMPDGTRYKPVKDVGFYMLFFWIRHFYLIL